MKIDIYTLLGMIKDGKAPKKIVYENCIYEYVDREEDYWDKNNIGLFDEYVISNILNDEVEILETTITYNQDDKIEKLKDILRVDDLEPPYDFNLQKIWCQTIKNQNKINEIIDYLNNKQ